MWALWLIVAWYVTHRLLVAQWKREDADKSRDARDLAKERMRR